MDWDSFYYERVLFLLDSNYAVVQQALVPGSSQIPEQSMPVSHFVTVHQQINYTTNIPNNENISREEVAEAFKIRVTALLKTTKTELRDAICALKEMTVFLGENSKPLSLFLDTPEEPHIQQENLILWRLLNICWLAVFQRQFESSRNDRRLNVTEMEAMGEFLIEFCDGIEPYGLVDYEMGAWEDEILDLITRCIDKYKAAEAAESGPPRRNTG